MPPVSDDCGPTDGPQCGNTGGGTTGVFDDILSSEPADPDVVDHTQRLQTPLAPLDTDVSTLPKPVVQCGCGECKARVDPLSDEIDDSDSVFADVLERSDYWAIDDCPNPVPMPVGKTIEATYRYQLSAYKRDDFSSKLDRAEQSHASILDSERDLLKQWGDDVSTALLSLRIPPIEPVEMGCDDGDADNIAYVWKNSLSTESTTDDTGSEQWATGRPDGVSGDCNGLCLKSNQETTNQSVDKQRQWVPPTQLVHRLRDSWQTVYDALRYRLRDFDDWEYLWLIGTTDSAATPHMHVYVWVRDPHNELSVDHVRPAVQSFVNNTPTARQKHHTVTEGKSDAAVVHTNTLRHDDISDEQLLAAMKRREVADSPMQYNTRGLLYLLNQRPAWVIKRLTEGTVNPDDRQTRLDLAGLATSWASSKNWIGSSGRIELK